MELQDPIGRSAWGLIRHDEQVSNSTSGGELRFSVDARHIQQLGRELVENQVTAVTELVKNAYDADASLVVVAGYGTHDSDGALVVVDNGVGMALDDVANGWMRLSSDGKERSPRSEIYGRVRAGRKGIGRFSTQTLAANLTMRTTCAGDARQLAVDFHWDRDYRPGVDLSTITNPYRWLPADPQAHGTALTMLGLHEPWTVREWNRVRDAVRLLQPPFPPRQGQAKSGRTSSVDPGFQVVVRPPVDRGELPDNTFRLLQLQTSEDDAFGAGAAGRDLDDFLSAATAIVTGAVDRAGVAHWRVDSDVLDLHDNTTAEQRFRRCGPLDFEVSYFIYRGDALGDVKVRIAQRMGNEYGGVRVYRDGLRVMPYGEREDDWLGLDQLAASRTVLPPIGNVNVFGAVLISRDRNPGLIDTASREGIVSGDALDDLRRVVRDALVWAALRVAAKRERKQSTTSTKRRPASRVEVVDRMIREVATTEVALDHNDVRDHLNEVVTELRDEAIAADRAEAEREADLVGELDLLRVLASLGTASSVFSHEVSGALHRSRAAADDVRRSIEPGSGSVAERRKFQRDALARLTDTLSQLRELSDYIAGYTSALRRRDRREQPVYRLVTDFLTAFGGLLSQRSITAEATINPRSLRTIPMARSEFEALLFNLLSNAVKALDRDGVAERRIRINVAPTADETGVILDFQDSGTGIDPSLSVRIFEPFVTSSTGTSPELGTGTGLGLAVVRDLVESYGGTASVGSADVDMSTNIQIVLPRAKSQLAKLVDGTADEQHSPR